MPGGDTRTGTTATSGMVTVPACQYGPHSSHDPSLGVPVSLTYPSRHPSPVVWEAGTRTTRYSPGGGGFTTPQSRVSYATAASGSRYIFARNGRIPAIQCCHVSQIPASSMSSITGLLLSISHRICPSAW